MSRSSPYLLTSYIYPLSEAVVLSEALQISLDNPRTPDELDEVATILKLSFEHPEQRMFGLNQSDERISLEEVLKQFGSSAGLHDPVVQDHYSKFNPDNLFNFLAGMWVIARYDDEGSSEELEADRKNMSSAKGPTVVLLENEHPLIRNANQLLHYSHLLSLLAHTLGEEYNGTSFMLDRGYGTRPRRDANRYLFVRDFTWFTIHAYDWRGPADIRDYSSIWSVLPHAIPQLMGAANKLEPLLRGADREKLLYIGNMLFMASPETVRDEKVRLLLLVSILESLLTHSPDYQRFNVEESISKQFVMKVALLVYLSDRTTDLGNLRKRLRLIYNMRSNVAHGNFGEIHKYVAKLSKKEGEEEYFSDLLTDLYRYLRAVVGMHASDRDLVHFLKEN